MQLYEQAIQSAHENGFVQNEALAHEVAARFYLARGFETIAYTYLRNARNCYDRWGALGKVKQLDEHYPRLHEERLPTSTTATIGTPVGQLDVETVVKASQALSSEMVLNKLVEKLMRIAVEHAGAERGLLILLRGDEPRIEAEANTGHGSVEVAVRQAAVTPSDLPESAFHYVIRTGERVVVDDASVVNLYSEDEYVRRKRPRSVLCLPIVKQMKLVGALYLENNLTPCAFTSDRVAVLELLASQAAISLENARLYSDLQRNEAFLAEGQSISHTGSFGWNIQSGEISWSDETFRIFEYDLTATPSAELVLHRVHPDDRAGVQQRMDRAYNDDTNFEHDYRLLLPDGRVKHLHVLAHALQDSSGNLEFVGAVMDVTTAKQAEEKLRQGERELRTTLETIPTFVVSALPDGSVDFVSQSLLDYAGFPVEAMLDWSWRNLTHPEDLAPAEKAWRKCLATGQPLELEVRFRQADGKYRWFLDRTVPLRDEKGNIVRWYATLNDIEDRKQAEDALRTSEQQWRDVFENNPTMYFMVDAEEAVMAVNPFGAEQLGYTVNELVGQPVLNISYEADQEAVQRNVAQCMKHLGQSLSWELRQVRKDGSMLWVRETARAVLRGDDRVVLIACEDITDRRNAEEKIRQGERELRQLIDLSPQHIAEFGPDGRRLYVNQAALDYYGLTLEEWLGGDMTRLLHPQDAERKTREARSKFLSGFPYEMEVRLRRRDGQYRWFLFRFKPMLDEQGRVTRWYGAGTDIEDHKEAEQRLQNENVALREEIDKASMFEEIVGTSPPLQTVLSRISKVAPANSSVLITGETGTGKELVARAIHRRSRRSSRAFVSVNCAAIPRDLIASELFGHEKGAFTGATQRRLGRFELAEGGTIFLDEIGELPAETQIALLRVLQEHEFERVGGSGSIQNDVRVIAATNRDLEAAISANTFRSDLFYRLNVFPIEMPPLRERREDIPLLVEYFIDRYARQAGKSFQTVNKKSLDLLQSYPWPGNIRELQNVIERSVIVCETENFSVDESWLSRQPAATDLNVELNLFKRLPSEEKTIIEAALSESGGRVYGPSGAAAKLGMPRSTLESKIRSLKIHKNRFKAAGPSKNN